MEGISGQKNYQCLGKKTGWSDCQSVCLSTCLSACLPACLSVCLSVYLSFCLSVFLIFNNDLTDTPKRITPKLHQTKTAKPVTHSNKKSCSCNPLTYILLRPRFQLNKKNIRNDLFQFQKLGQSLDLAPVIRKKKHHKAKTSSIAVDKWISPAPLLIN